jgi:four helix bundle protein
MDFAVACHQFACGLPRSEKFELASQIRRAASSVPLSIAEGFGLGTRQAFIRHLRIARGSAFEVQTGLDICVRVGHTPAPVALHDLAEESVRLIQALINSIERRMATDR